MYNKIHYNHTSIMAIKELIAVTMVCLTIQVANAFYSSEPTYHTCCASGDPHYYPFDGGVIHFQGTCRYLLAGTCSPCSDVEGFQVYVENENRGNPSVSITKAVEIHYKGWIIRFEKNGVIKVKPFGGAWMSPGLPFNAIPGAIITKTSWNHMVFETYDGIRIEYSDNHRVCVTVPCKYKKKMCGICGNLNDVMDDYVTSDDTDVSTAPNMYTLIGNSWQVAPGSISSLPRSCYREPTYVPGEDFKPSGNNVGMCAHLRRTSAPLAECIAQYPELAKQYFESCVYDINAQVDDKTAHCASIEAFIRECQRLSGMEFPGWRRQLQCPCPGNTYTDPCPRITYVEQVKERADFIAA